MKKYKRMFTIVIDSLGIGAMEDSEQFGDKGVNTLGHIAEQMEDFQIPNLRKLGIANLCSLSGLAPEEKPLGYRMVMREMSNGKDTMTGHWEMMGIHTTKPFQTFTDTGFPPELIKELEERTGRTVIGNKSASGTEILDEDVYKRQDNVVITPHVAGNFFLAETFERIVRIAGENLKAWASGEELKNVVDFSTGYRK